MNIRIASLVAAGLILLGQGCSSGQTSAPVTPAANTPAAVAPTGETATIEIMAGGQWSPAEITVKAGTTVTFTNKDSAKHWPASAVHPTHKECPGFDAKKGLGQGESYSFTFTEKKACAFHDHLNPGGPKGKVIVE